MHVCVNMFARLFFPGCWTVTLPRGAARLIKSTLRLNHREEQNGSGLS